MTTLNNLKTFTLLFSYLKRDTYRYYVIYAPNSMTYISNFQQKQINRKTLLNARNRSLNLYY